MARDYTTSTREIPGDFLYQGIARYSTHNAAEFVDQHGKITRFDEPSLRTRIANGGKYNFDVSEEKVGLAALTKVETA